MRWLRRSNLWRWFAVCSLALACHLAASGRARGQEGATLAERLRTLDWRVAHADEEESLREMVERDLAARLREANLASTAAWQAIDGLDAWRTFRDEKLARLRESLGEYPESPPSPPTAHVTGTHRGDGFVVDNVAFESRPGWWVSSNLYRPAAPPSSMPGIVVCHSHHTPKEQGELQDMGMTWARAGCLVLVPDQLGHGERRQHPFVDESSYAGSFRLSRQDYWFRYDSSVRLQLLGDTLMGWMAWDLSRGVDLLLAQAGVDPQRIVLLGAVAGGGDPAAVAAALDERIAAAVPFNFGGPQPETRYPLPEDAAETFDYAGSGGWEATRNLALSARDGFLPWAIVGGIAPRRLVYAHEFRWDQERDPVWARLQQIYALHGASEHLDSAHGRGELRGEAPEATHCTHIGREHRVRIHEAFARWFDSPVGPEQEYSARLSTEELRCFSPEIAGDLSPLSLSELLPRLAEERQERTRAAHDRLQPGERRARVREDWRRILGPVELAGVGDLTAGTEAASPRVVTTLEGARAERFLLTVETGIHVPVVLLLPEGTAAGAADADAGPARPPVVLALSQAGKERFLQHRSREIAELLADGIAVCLCDLRGTGESSLGEERGRTGAATAYSSSEQMLGGTLVGARLRDARSVLEWLRTRDDLDASRIALWGDSFVPPQAGQVSLDIPRDDDAALPEGPEPLGGLVALLAALFEDDIDAVFVRGGIGEFGSVLGQQLVLVPHDVVAPGIVAVGDVPALVATLAPCPVALCDTVDGVNRRLEREALRVAYGRAIDAHAASHSLTLEGDDSPASWLRGVWSAAESP